MPIEDKFLKPAYPGLIVRDPVTLSPLSGEGELKPWYGSKIARYWRKQVNDGSVIISKQEKPKAVKKSPPTQIQEEVELRELNFKRRKVKEENE